jgi:hypothetical protein
MPHQDTHRLDDLRQNTLPALDLLPSIAALWLIPDHQTTESLRQVIEQYTGGSKLKFFQPHVTVQSGKVEELPALDVLHFSAKCFGGSLVVDIKSINFESSFFRSVYIDCVLNEVQHRSAVEIGVLLGLNGAKPFNPQLKFAGGVVDPADHAILREALANQLKTITFNRICFASVPNDEIAWNSIGRWQLTEMVSL